MAAVTTRPGFLLTEAEVAWRKECVERLGFADADAVALAENTEVDIHDVAKLIDRGCPLDLAMEIVR